MAKKTLSTFVPKQYVKHSYDPKRIYGVEFTKRGGHEAWDAIQDATRESDEPPAHRIIGRFVLHQEVNDLLRDQYGMTNAYSDDIIVHLCKELGIDYREFEHDVPKLPIDAFVALVGRRFANLKLPTNEIQWTLQHGQWAKLWNSWVKSECRRSGCEEESHYDCEERYVRPNFWELALQLEAGRQAKAELVESIDAVPRGRAVKATNDALARIAIAARG